MIAPEGIVLPPLPDRYGWRNPMRDYDYVRDVWVAFRILPGHSEELATVRQIEPGVYAVALSAKAGGNASRTFRGAEAFELAAEWARNAP